MPLQLRELKEVYAQAPNSWKCPEDHFHQVLKSEWYQTVYQIKKTIFSASYEFYKDMGLSPAPRFAIVCITILL